MLRKVRFVYICMSACEVGSQSDIELESFRLDFDGRFTTQPISFVPLRLELT